MIGYIVLFTLAACWLLNLIDETARNAGRASWSDIVGEGVGGAAAFVAGLTIMLNSSPDNWHGAPLGLLCAMVLGGFVMALWRLNCAIARLLNAFILRPRHPLR